MVTGAVKDGVKLTEPKGTKLAESKEDKKTIKKHDAKEVKNSATVPNKEVDGLNSDHSLTANAEAC